MPVAHGEREEGPGKADGPERNGERQDNFARSDFGDVGRVSGNDEEYGQGEGMENVTRGRGAIAFENGRHGARIIPVGARWTMYAARVEHCRARESLVDCDSNRTRR